MSKLALVTWTDAVYCDDYDADDPITPLRCRAVGFEIDTSAEYLTIALEAFEDGTYRRALTIPRAMILSVEYLQHEQVPLRKPASTSEKAA